MQHQKKSFLFTLPSGRGLVLPVFFPVVFIFFFWWSLAPHFCSAKKYLPVIFACLAFIRQNFHESWRRKSLAIEWHKNPFNESKNRDANEP